MLICSNLDQGLPETDKGNGAGARNRQVLNLDKI